MEHLNVYEVEIWYRRGDEKTWTIKTVTAKSPEEALEKATMPIGYKIYTKRIIKILINNKNK